MGDHGIQRRLAAILAADVAGYTRLMEEDTGRHRRRLDGGPGRCHRSHRERPFRPHRQADRRRVPGRVSHRPASRRLRHRHAGKNGRQPAEIPHGRQSRRYHRRRARHPRRRRQYRGPPGSARRRRRNLRFRPRLRIHSQPHRSQLRGSGREGRQARFSTGPGLQDWSW